MIVPNIFNRRHKDCPQNLGIDAARALVFPACENILYLNEKFEHLIRGNPLVFTTGFLDKPDCPFHTGFKVSEMPFRKFVGTTIIKDQKTEFALRIQHIPYPNGLIFPVINMVWVPAEKWFDQLIIIKIVGCDKLGKSAVVCKWLRKFA